MVHGKGNPFRDVQVLKPGRSVFDLSYAKKFSGRMGYLYPVMCDEMVPGDVFDVGAEVVVRFAPMVAPVLHEINCRADWFFVPYRILYAKAGFGNDGLTAWESFITGGRDGASTVTRTDIGVVDMHVNAVPEGGLWDFLGVPTGVVLAANKGNDSPLAIPGAAYGLIYEEYYRDPNLEDETDIWGTVFTASNAGLQYANWDADYFTRALPWQQRGTTPALPVTGSVAWDSGRVVNDLPGSVVPANFRTDVANDSRMHVNSANAKANADAFLNNNTLSATTFSVNDLRLAVQLQRWLERNAQSGARYTEFLRSHFGVAPRDDRLDRPEYIGGFRTPILVSEVLQTSKSEAGAPQGNLAGHGISAGRQSIGRYHAKEYGLMMCLMSVAPRPAYQQGIDKQWLRVSRYDFYHPEFANLSEQAVLEEEVYLSAAQGTNLSIFGYQGRYNEMRAKRDMVHGAMRSSLNTWHLGRIFGAAPALNGSFGHTDPAALTRIFAVPAADHLYVHWGNSIRAIRPLPPMPQPGRMDHSYGGF